MLGKWKSINPKIWEEKYGLIDVIETYYQRPILQPDEKNLKYLYENKMEELILMIRYIEIIKKIKYLIYVFLVIISQNVASGQEPSYELCLIQINPDSAVATIIGNHSGYQNLCIASEAIDPINKRFFSGIYDYHGNNKRILVFNLNTGELIKDFFCYNASIAYDEKLGILYGLDEIDGTFSLISIDWEQESYQIIKQFPDLNVFRMTGYTFIETYDSINKRYIIGNSGRLIGISTKDGNLLFDIETYYCSLEYDNLADKLYGFRYVLIDSATITQAIVTVNLSDFSYQPLIPVNFSGITYFRSAFDSNRKIYYLAEGENFTGIDLNSGNIFYEIPHDHSVYVVDYVVDQETGLLYGVTYREPTIINDKFKKNSIPGFELNQNYPNPFNPSTKITFNLPKTEIVRIEIYNTLGQKIETLLNKPMTTGYNLVEFNGKNLSGGVYFYRIEAGEFQDVKKMILLK